MQPDRAGARLAAGPCGIPGRSAGRDRLLAASLPRHEYRSATRRGRLREVYSRSQAPERARVRQWVLGTTVGARDESPRCLSAGIAAVPGGRVEAGAVAIVRDSFRRAVLRCEHAD